MIPQTGDVVAVLPEGTRGVVVAVTQFVTGEGRYVSVVLEGTDAAELIHESRVKKIDH